MRADSTCKHCKVRWSQQQKYLKEAYELYGEVRERVLRFLIFRSVVLTT
jgi:hypothetical protein